MKCPYNNFEECIVEQCPACVYEKLEFRPGHSEGHWVDGVGFVAIRDVPPLMPEYRFKSCKYVDHRVRPVVHDVDNSCNRSVSGQQKAGRYGS